MPEKMLNEDSIVVIYDQGTYLNATRIQGEAHRCTSRRVRRQVASYASAWLCLEPFCSPPICTVGQVEKHVMGQQGRDAAPLWTHAAAACRDQASPLYTTSHRVNGGRNNTEKVAYRQLHVDNRLDDGRLAACPVYSRARAGVGNGDERLIMCSFGHR